MHEKICNDCKSITLNNNLNIKYMKENGEHFLKEFPGRVPILLYRKKDDDLPILPKTRYLVPLDMPFMHFMSVLRKKLILPPHKALFLLTRKRRLVHNAMQVGGVYESDKCDDGFLRIHMHLKMHSANFFCI